MELTGFNRVNQWTTMENYSWKSIALSLCPFLLILVTLLAYWPGINGLFILDDFHILKRLNDYGGVTNTQSLLQFIFGDTSGFTSRPLSQLSFLIDDQYWPSDPSSFKYTNLLIHILCGICLYLLFFRLAKLLNLQQTPSLIIASMAAAIWLLHPLNVSTTLYVVQRMTQLMTLFTLVGLLFYIHGRSIVDDSTNRGLVYMSLSLFPFGLMSFLCKENGVLILFYILVMEFTLFQQHSRPRLFKYWLALAIGLPIAILIGYFTLKWGATIRGYNLREFSLSERLLTESRVLVTYISYIFFPRTSGTGLFHDDIEISTGLLTPTTTIFSIIILLTSLILALVFRKRCSVISFAILWFYAGHLLESTFLNLELYFEHRNYLPMAGFIFAFSYYTFIWFNQLSFQRYRKIFYIVSSAILVVLFIQTYKLSIVWSKPDNMFPLWSQEHPDSLRAQVMYAKYLELNRKPGLALQVLDKTSAKFTHDLTAMINSLIISCKFNLQINVTPEALLARVSTARYTSGLLNSMPELINLNTQNQCTTFTYSQLHQLLDRLKKLPSITLRRKQMSKLLFVQAQISIKQGNLSRTMELLDQANTFYPGVSIPLYQAFLLGSAGLYKHAIEYLDIAAKADTKRKPLAPSRMDEISTLKTQYINQIR